MRIDRTHPADRPPLSPPDSTGHGALRSPGQRVSRARVRFGGFCRLAGTTLALGLALAVTGCGSTASTGTAGDPATVVPATAPLYVGAEVRPEGSLKGAAAAVGKALSQEADPYLHLLAALQTPGSAKLSYASDVAPWLGGKAGLFLSSVSGATGAEMTKLLPELMSSLAGGSVAASFPFSAGGLQGALVLDTSDAGKARSFLNAQAARAAAHASSYRGVSYEQGATGVVFAMVDRYAVIGTEAAVHSVIDTTLGGASLARAAGYSRLLAKAPSGAIGHVYANPTAYAGSPGGLTGLLALLAGGAEANLSLVPGASSLTVDIDTPGTGAPGAADATSAASALLYSGSQATKALGELPGESWLALGLGNLGLTLSADVKGLEGLSSLAGSLGTGTPAPSRPPSSSISIKGLSLKSVLKGVLTPLAIMGADTATAKRVFRSWMGSAGIYASGSGLLELDGGVVIDSNNAALSRAAVPALAKALQQAGASVETLPTPGTEAAVTASVSGLPLLLVVAAGRDSAGQPRFVVGLGQSSVTAALNPSGTLASASTYRSAAQSLGAQPNLIASVPTVLALLEGAGLSEEPAVARLLPLLRGVNSVTGGDESAGSLKRFKLVLGLHEAG